MTNQVPIAPVVESELERSLTVELNKSLNGESCISCGATRCVDYLSAPDRFFARSTQYRLLRCQACSLVWLADPPSPGEMYEHYGPRYDRFIQRATDYGTEEHWRDALNAVKRYSHGGRLLDLGCGSGLFLSCLRGHAWNLWGIEMSADAAELARSRSGATVLADDILQAPFLPEMFDVITCFHVFEHVNSPREVLLKVREWLKPGGIFCLQVPNIEAAERRLFGSYWYPLELPRHLYHFSPASLTQLARSIGLDPESITTARASFVEHSLRYFADDALRRMRIHRPSVAEAGDPSLAWRIVRKGLRLTLLPVANWLINLGGDGSIIEAVFRKPETTSASINTASGVN